MSNKNAAAVLAAAVSLAKQWAADDAHGYDQANRWGPDYDCSSFLISVWEDVGVPVKEAGATYTGNMRPAFLACGFRDVTAEVNVRKGGILRAGDVLLNIRQHTAMYIGDGLIVHAAGNELGGITGGKTGDQTGREICTTGYYYSPSCPWECVLRYEGDEEPQHEPADVSIPNTAGRYIVKSGDTLWGIAERYLGHGWDYPKLIAANPGLTADIYPGQVIKIPGAEEPEPEPEDPEICTATLPVLKPGDVSLAVKALQSILIMRGFLLECTGDFDSPTAVVVKGFQSSSGLRATGTVDGDTWAALIG